MSGLFAHAWQMEADARVKAFHAFYAIDAEERDPWTRFSRALLASCQPIRDRRALTQLAVLSLSRRGHSAADIAERLDMTTSAVAELVAANRRLEAECRAEREAPASEGGRIADASDGHTLEVIASRNIAKLSRRYPDRFTADAALNRCLDLERKALEGHEADRQIAR